MAFNRFYIPKKPTNMDMKKTILGAITWMGLSATIYGQSVLMDNMSGGGLWLDLRPNDQINATLWGGPVGGSLQPIVTLTGGSLLSLGGGLVYDPSGLSYAIPGVAANAQASLQLQFWVGTDLTYAAAVAAGKMVITSPVYTNPTGGGGSPPSITPSAMANMPNIAICICPEPSTLALAGFGAAASLMYRRRSA